MAATITTASKPPPYQQLAIPAQKIGARQHHHSFMEASATAMLSKGISLPANECMDSLFIVIATATATDEAITVGTAADTTTAPALMNVAVTAVITAASAAGNATERLQLRIGRTP